MVNIPLEVDAGAAGRRKVSNSNLTHLRLASLLWDIGKQNSPRCDAAECKMNSNTTKNESGHIQLIDMGESIRPIWVNVHIKCKLVNFWTFPIIFFFIKIIFFFAET